jgi:multiple sugar transport system substrate-binding protein
MKTKMSRREFLRNVSLGSAGLLLVGCQPVGIGPASGQQSQTGAVAGAEQVVVRVFDYDPTGTDAWVTADQQFVEYFTEKYPEIEVIREQAPWTGFTEKLLTSIAGGAKYDVIYGYWQWLPQFIENDVVGPLNDVIAGDSEINDSDFYDYARENVDGQTYGLAWFISGWLHWFNRSAVEEAGHADLKALDVDGEWTYDTWYQFAKEMTGEREGAPIFGYDLGSTRSPSVYTMLAWAWGTTMWDEGFTQSTMNSAENVELWTYIQQFYNEGLSPKPGTAGLEESNGFTNGRIMGTMAGQWFTRNIVQDGAPEAFDIGMVTFPTGPAGKYSVAALNSFYFSKDPSDASAAWTWYKERSFSPKAGEIYAAIGGGRFPSNRNIAPAVLYEWEDTEVYESIRPILRPYSASPKESEFVEMWGAAWDEMVLGTRSVPEVLEQLASEATDLVARS